MLFGGAHGETCQNIGKMRRISGGNDVTAMAAQVLEVRDSTTLTRFLLQAAAAGRADADRLARESRLPGWALAADGTMLPSRYALRLWELIEHSVEVPHAALAIASRYQPGSLELYDYLFTTSATLRDGMGATRDFLHLVTTNGRMEVRADNGGETSYSYQHVETGSRGAELARQFAVGVMCMRARAATGRMIVPEHITFAQPAPRSYREFTEMFGTSRIDFDAPVTTFTFRASDLDLPLRGADPALARILLRYAASMPAPPPVTWRDHVQQQLADLIEGGSPSIEALARRLAVSIRTLQRQFAEQGTTWRAELDTARYRRAIDARRAGVSDLTRLARQLGYADPGSARRALTRWDDGGRRDDRAAESAEE
jgi:AraC-like DNA-binding protein